MRCATQLTLGEAGEGRCEGNLHFGEVSICLATDPAIRAMATTRVGEDVSEVRERESPQYLRPVRVSASTDYRTESDPNLSFER